MRIGESNNIKDIAPILAGTLIDNFDVPVQLVEQYQRYYALKRKDLGLLGKYLNNQMADFEIMSVEKREDRVSMIINDLNYCLMAKEREKGRGQLLDKWTMFFPLIFHFEGIKHYSVNEVRSNGKIVEINDYSIIPGSQILFDQLIFLDKNAIELGFSLWKFIENKGRNFLLLLSTQRYKVAEMQIEAFNSYGLGISH